jgi:phage terminase large subunit-like protein
VLGREKTTRRWLLWSKAWAHKSVLDRRKSEASVLRDFEQAGDLVICERLGDDVADIASLARRIDETGLLHAVGLDPFGVGAIVDALAEAGITGQDRVIGISQGWKLTGAIKTTERKLADGTLSHGGRGLMAWAVSNAKVEPKGNAIVITKQASGTAKTDPAHGVVQRRRADVDEPRGRGVWLDLRRSRIMGQTECCQSAKLIYRRLRDAPDFPRSPAMSTQRIFVAERQSWNRSSHIILERAT